MENVFIFGCIGLLLLGCFIGGILMIISAMRSKRKAEASRSWSGIQGSITKSWVEKVVTTDADGIDFTSYKPRINYQYSIGGQSYSGDRLTFGAVKNYNRRQQAEQVLAAYPENGAVTIYYDPQDPAQATLLQQSQGGVAMIIGGVVLILIPIFTLCIGLFSMLMAL